MRKVSRALVTHCLALGVVLFALTPAAAQDATTSGTIDVMDVGDFNVTLCEATDFGSVSTTSSTGGVSTGTVTICYFDDAAERDAQSVHLVASDLESDDPESDAMMPASSLSILGTHAPLITQAEGCGLNIFEDGVGLIYARNESTLLAPSHPGEEPQPLLWGENSLATRQLIGEVVSGSGTSDPHCEHTGPDITAVVDIQVTVPPAQLPGDYTTTITLDVVPVTAPE